MFESVEGKLVLEVSDPERFLAASTELKGPLKSFLSEPSADRRQSNHHFLLLLGAALAWKPATADGPGSRLFGAGGKYQG